MIKKGDKVIVITGKNKGTKGTVAQVLPVVGKVVIEGVNVVKKHLKKGRGVAGQIIEKALPINISNVMTLDPKTGTRTRLGVKQVGDKNIRITRKSGQEI